MRTPRVAVIIVSYNALPILQKCLPTVAQTSWPNLEIVFADNNSTDGSSEWIAGQFPGIRIIRHPENWLFSRGNNEAIREVTADYIVLLNNDVAVPEDWLQPLVSFAESNPSFAALQPKILQFSRRDHFEYAGACGGYLDRLGYPLARGRIFDHTEQDAGQYDMPVRIDWASGAAMLLRRSALDSIGPLDETFGLHMEEIDLCWRLRRSGHEIGVVPESQVYHIGGATLPRENERKLYYNIRNSLLMLYKNLPPSHFRAVLLRRIILDHSVALAWLLGGKWRRTRAVIRGYVDAHRKRSNYSQPTEATALPSYRGLILLEYLLMGRRRFSDLPDKRLSLNHVTAPPDSTS